MVCRSLPFLAAVRTAPGGGSAMRIIRRTVSMVGAVVLMCVLAVPAFAYGAPISVNITVTGQVAGVTSGQVASETCGQYSLSATVAGASGTGVPGVAVTWAITSAPSGAHDKLGSSTTTTGSNGVATNTLRLSCVAGNRVVQANTGGVLGAISINSGGSGLPNTSTVPSTPTSQSLPATSLLFLGIAIGCGMALGVRRFRA